jgi:hypothetical protein
MADRISHGRQERERRKKNITQRHRARGGRVEKKERRKRNGAKNGELGGGAVSDYPT